ncbi:MAG: hypothetical protein HYX63_12410 [Gammaproteobacteria bacterium]|nr:hypothetical protein [Gammaproteobacteria bacterium]
MNRLNSFAVAIALTLGVSTVHAASINLAPASRLVVSGGQVTFDIVANFGNQSVLGGGTDYSWDSNVLTLAGFAFSPALASRDTDFDAKQTPNPPPGTPTGPFDVQTPSLLSIVFIKFSGLSIATDTVIGTLTFTASGAPGSSTLISLADSIKWDGYFVANTQVPIPVTYTGATAQILPLQTVPLPAAGWLLGIGMLGLLGAARHPRSSRGSAAPG